jgi:hypothetical protein
VLFLYQFNCDFIKFIELLRIYLINTGILSQIIASGRLRERLFMDSMPKNPFILKIYAVLLHRSPIVIGGSGYMKNIPIMKNISIMDSKSSLFIPILTEKRVWRRISIYYKGSKSDISGISKRSKRMAY